MRVTYDVVNKLTDPEIPDGWYLRQTKILEEGNLEETYKGPFKSEREALRYALAQGPHNNPFTQEDGSLEITLPPGAQLC